MDARLRHEPGERIVANLEVVGVLGSGTFGTVYHCRDFDGGPDRAVKEMHLFLDPPAVAQAVGRFRREADCLARCNHHLIPKAELLEVPGPFYIHPQTGRRVPFDQDGALELALRSYLVMDYRPGQTLESRLAEEKASGLPPGLEEVLKLVQQVGEALSHLHGHGLLHRDVKPANILLAEPDSTAYLLDFGLASRGSWFPGYGTVPIRDSGAVGTPGYAPPDPVEQEHPVPASDQYALAITARQVLTGLDPTRLDQAEELTSQPLLDLRPDLKPHVGHALDRAIRPDANERWPDLHALVEALTSPPVPLAYKPRSTWLELRPETLDAGSVAPGQLRDLTIALTDARPGVRPRGYANSNDERLRILPPSAHGSDIALHLLLKVPRDATAGPVKTQLTVSTDEEERVVPITYVVDPDATNTRRLGCGAWPLLLWPGGSS